MQNSIPDKIWLYRITHYQNIPHILRNGIVTSGSNNANPSFVNIGDNSLIQIRKDKTVIITPGGYLSEYIPFYFGAHSPMLLQIITGNQGVTKRPQGDIVYLISSLSKIEEIGCSYIFSDGHAWDGMSTLYNNPSDLNKVDWNIVKDKNWKNDDDNFDRKRRKQAELLVHNHVPITCIEYIVVYDDIKLKFVQNEISKAGLSVPVHISTKHYY
ncbi:MAG: DUF4433 domain-containing protein [Bacteroidetes bacterium]|nr:DUF4433 domain-containing protein [Bacteroidota bacterium]